MINQKFDDFSSDIYTLKNLDRYQCAPRIKSETVAEHSYFVTVLVLKLHDDYDFNLEKALKMALLHDYPESRISDVPNPVKNEFPEIRDALEKAEKGVCLKHLGEEYSNLLEEFNNKSSVEGLICYYADVCSCIQYSSLEVNLGNKDYMSEVLRNSKKRADEVKQKLKNYLRIKDDNSL